MKIGIIGIGAMGCLFGSHLAQVSTVTLTLIGHWPEQLASLSQHGLQVETANTQPVIQFLQATNDPGTVGKVDLVLICVKSRQTQTAAAIAKKILSATGLVLTLQNGLGNVDQLTAVLGQDRV